MRVLVGTVGYQNLQNHSVGPILFPQLEALRTPQTIVEELNWGPVAIVQRLEAEPEPFGRVVLISARSDDRPEGTLTLYRWQGGLPEPFEIQSRIAEAVTGVISVDNLLVVGEHFQVWPPELFLIDVAPGPEAAGPDLRSPVRRQLPAVLDHARRLARTGQTSATLQPLYGSRIDLCRSTLPAE